MAESTIDRQVLTDLVRLACRAPSVHNSQPWHLVFSDGELRLFIESHRCRTQPISPAARP